MAYSLEAAIAMPLVLGAWLGLMQAAPEAYSQARLAAKLEIRALVWSSSTQDMYSTETIVCQDRWTPALGCSPQKILEVSGLVSDHIHYIGSLVDIISPDEDRP